jgi:phosphomannomutase
MIDYKLEDIPFEDVGNYKILNLPPLTKDEINIIDPIVAPTSGLRIQILETHDEDGSRSYFLPKRNLYLFLRVFKAISHKYKKLKGENNLRVLIVTDDRPTKDILLKYCSQIFSYEGFEIYYQKDNEGKSRISSPYGAASVTLIGNIGLVIVLTASHNDLSWNGIKFYIDYPIPISGDLFKDISKKALDYEKIELNPDFKPILIDAEQMNNDYVIDLLSNVLEIRSLIDKDIVIWPYLGKARGIVNLFTRLGARVHLIQEEINPPNPIKEIREERLQKEMNQSNSDLAILLDADRDRIALYVKQDGKYCTYIPNEIYSAMHNILAKEFNKKIINVRTIPSDLRGDESSFINILTGVGYKHLGIILYFLFDIEVDQSKIDSAILYIEGENKELIKINESGPLKEHIKNLMKENHLDDQQFIIVMWEESGGHTLNILDVTNVEGTNNYDFNSQYPLIADKYPVPALVLASELIARGYKISESIDWSIVGINQTIHANDEEKVKIMKNFAKNDGNKISVDNMEYSVDALSDNNNNIDIYRLKSEDSMLYFRPSGTGPDVRFYIFANREKYQEEINKVMQYVKNNYA